jgi:site-specific DNA-methyltransferase (adenine-specific)
MEKIKIDQITIKERIRQTFDSEKLQQLADSIKQFGQIEPIIIDQSNQLIAGERRLRACQLANLTEVEVERREVRDDWERKALELEENICREDLTWQEEVRAKAELHSLYQERYGQTESEGGHGGKRVQRGKDEGWTIDDTAELTGDSHGSLSQDLQLARAIVENPSLLQKETKSAAFKAMTVMRELGMKRELAEVFASISEKRGEEQIQIINGDSSIILKEFDDESFDFCVTDPEYGIGLHDMQDTFPNRGDVRQGVEFDDSKKRMTTELPTIFKEVYRILREGSHCYVFFAIARYTEVRQILEEAGFWVCSTPLLWIKNNALNLRPWLSYPVNYEPIFYCSKGYPPRPLSSIQKLSTFDHPILSGSRKVHPTEKPLLLIKQLIENCSQPKERGIDPFLGGGTFTLALKETGRIGIGIELDKNWWLCAKERLESTE